MTPLASEIVPPEYYGATIGALETIKDIGQASGPIITGFILSSFKFNQAYIVMAFITLISLAMFVISSQKSSLSA